MVNESLIIQAAWNIVNNKNPFLTNILKAKYFPNDSFWTTTNNGPRSSFWSSILQDQQELGSNSIYQLYSGNTSVWSTPWSSVWDNIYNHLLLPVINNPLPAKIPDLWNPNTHSWNNQLLSTTFLHRATQEISATPIIQSDSEDILRWKPAKNGLCTTESIYHHLSPKPITHCMSMPLEQLVKISLIF